MTDLVSGRYGAYDPMWLIFGRPVNATQSDVPARSNVWTQKLTKLEDGALAATEVGCVVPVPVQEGDVFTSATYLIGATAGNTVSAGFAALYAGKAGGKLLAQSKTKNYGAITASEAYKFELEKSVLITSENAPKGFVYVVLVLVSAVTIPTALSSPVPKACQYEWFTGGPEVLAGTVGTGLGATAEATLGTVTSKVSGPLVFLQ
jgi:hypothetical protein